MDCKELVEHLKSPTWQYLEDPDSRLLPDAATAITDLLARCTGTGYLRNAGKGGMGRESVGKPAISKGLSAVWAGIGAAAYHLS